MYSKYIVNSIKIPEILELLLYLFIAFVLVYFVPYRLNRILFLGFIPLIWNSKKPYFWIVFIFILLEQPSGLFSGGLRNDPFRLPIYPIASGISVAFHQLVFLTLFFKFLNKSKTGKKVNPFRKELQLLSILFLILIIISPLQGRISLDIIIRIITLSISWTYFYSYIGEVDTKENLLRFLSLVFPFVFIALLSQVYGLITGHQLIAVLKPGVDTIQGVYTKETMDSWLRPIEMPHAVFITFTGSLVLLSGRSYKSRYYLILINIISFLVMFLTGSRSWIVAFLIGYVLFIIINIRSSSQLFFKAVLAIAIFVFILLIVPVLSGQVKNSWSRVSTLETVIEGDITGGGTIKRYSERAPKVMDGFFDSTIILGAGFSEHYYKYQDGHVGYHNILLNSGIIGAFIFAYVIYKLLSFPFRLSYKPGLVSNLGYFRSSIIPLFLLLIINSGTQTIGFTPDGTNRILLMAYAVGIIIVIGQKDDNELQYGDE